MRLNWIFSGLEAFLRQRGVPGISSLYCGE